jgi:cation transport regulator ChaC
MNLNSLIINTLQPLNVPVAFLVYTGTTRPYITFLELDQRSAFDCDDEEKETGHTIQVDVFHTGNYNSLVESVKQKLKEVGFTRTNEQDFYETDTKLYHKVIRFSYYEEVL